MKHRYQGECPDELNPDARDKSCPACRALDQDESPRKSNDEMQLDAAMSAAAIAWGWLWHVTTADDRVKTARHLLGQMLDKDLKRYGIQTAKAEGALATARRA